MQIDDRFTCPDAPLSPPEEEEDTRSRCRCCGEMNKLIYRERRCRDWIYGCEHCIVALKAVDEDDEPLDCTECKSEVDCVYMDRRTGRIIGCEECVEVVDAE